MKVFTTTNPIYEGIKECEVESYSGRGLPHAVRDIKTGQIYCGKSWFTTREAAVVRANEMRDLRIKSVTKQLERLKNLKFT